MKTTALTILCSLLMILFASCTGIVGFHYPVVLEDEPLNSPIEVLGVDQNCIFLSDFRVVEVRSVPEDRLREAIQHTNFVVDIEGSGSLVAIHARKDALICGTAWDQPIRIPLIPDTVYRNRRELLAFGELIETD